MSEDQRAAQMSKIFSGLHANFVQWQQIGVGQISEMEQKPESGMHLRLPVAFGSQRNFFSGLAWIYAWWWRMCYFWYFELELPI